MGVQFNLINFDNSIFSTTLEVTKETFLLLIIKPHWVFTITTIFTILANKETFPMHNQF